MRAALFALALTVAATGVASARILNLDDAKSVVGVSDAQISPDGTRILYVVSRGDYDTDATDATLMLRDLRAGTDRALTYDRAGLASPRWSPDGRFVAFLAKEGMGDDARAQVWVANMGGGDPTPITHAAQGVDGFAWRPDGAAIAYVTADAPANAALAKEHRDAFVVGDQSYRDRSAPSSEHIWIVNADGSGNVRLTSGTWSVATPMLSWSPDGAQIVFTKAENGYSGDADHSTIAVLDVATGAVRRLTSHDMFEGNGAFSPDGKFVAYTYRAAGDGSAQHDLFVAPFGRADGSDITDSGVGANVRGAMWMPDSSALLVAGHEGTDAALWIVSAGGAAQRLALHGVQPAEDPALDAGVASTGAIAFVGSEPHHPSELYYMASPQSAPRRLTSYNDAIAALDLGSVATVTWNGPDGYAEDGVLTSPPDRTCDSARACPLVVLMHDGPHDASIADFSFLNQALASRGYLVFNPNYRGSDNLGGTYWSAIVNDAGAGPGNDVMAGVAALEARGIVDASRIAASGWGYGGFMTAWLTGDSHMWKAAVAGAPLTDWMDQYVLSQSNVLTRYQFAGATPFVKNGMTAYMAQSPVNYAWNSTTPTLILADTADVRVPITQSYKLYHALKDHGAVVRFFAYPVAGHFPSDPVRRLDIYTRWSAWLTEYLK
jgi:dipeptidyl aminopeptidase/acylaminoacyl peptidase